jgi:hypothetical protein
MNHLEILGTFNEFNYVLYEKAEPKLATECRRGYKLLQDNGNVVGGKWSLTGGILLESGEKVIAGIFFNTTDYEEAILIHLAFVDEEYRNRGIYRTLHGYIDQVGKQTGKTGVYSYIHLGNKVMVDYICEKIGYKPIMQLVQRPIKE